MNEVVKKLAILYNQEVCNAQYDDYDEPDKDAVEVLTWLFSKPLIERLSDKDRELLNNIYSEAVHDIEYYQDKANSTFDDLVLRHYERAKEERARYLKAKLEEIFGAFNKLTKESTENQL